jgi:hypothetical protein
MKSNKIIADLVISSLIIIVILLSAISFVQLQREKKAYSTVVTTLEKNIFSNVSRNPLCLGNSLCLQGDLMAVLSQGVIKLRKAHKVNSKLDTNCLTFYRELFPSLSYEKVSTLALNSEECSLSAVKINLTEELIPILMEIKDLFRKRTTKKQFRFIIHVSFPINEGFGNRSYDGIRTYDEKGIKGEVEFSPFLCEDQKVHYQISNIRIIYSILNKIKEDKEKIEQLKNKIIEVFMLKKSSRSNKNIQIYSNEYENKPSRLIPKSYRELVYEEYIMTESYKSSHTDHPRTRIQINLQDLGSDRIL